MSREWRSSSIRRSSRPTKLFYYNDHLGGINVITDDVVSHNGARQQLIEYDPWGKISRSEGINLESERRFTGQILDPEFGLYYYGARYYDPELARFISPDPIVPSPGDPQTLNRYSYVRNNPVKYIDPTGHNFWSDLGNFFKNFFKSLPALITGIVVGWATWGLGGPVLGPILAGMLGGMAAAAVNTAMNGGNFGYNIGMGALFGGIAGAVGPGVFGALGGDASAGFTWGNFVAALKIGAVTEAAVGGLNTAISGGNFFQNVAFGALGGAMGAAVGYGVSYGLHKGWAAAKEWWNSMPGKSGPQGFAGTRPDGIVGANDRNPIYTQAASGDNIRMRDLDGGSSSCPVSGCQPVPAPEIPQQENMDKVLDATQDFLRQLSRQMFRQSTGQFCSELGVGVVCGSLATFILTRRGPAAGFMAGSMCAFTMDVACTNAGLPFKR